MSNYLAHQALPSCSILCTVVNTAGVRFGSRKCQPMVQTQTVKHHKAYIAHIHPLVCWKRSTRLPWGSEVPAVARDVSHNRTGRMGHEGPTVPIHSVPMHLWVHKHRTCTCKAASPRESTPQAPCPESSSCAPSFTGVTTSVPLEIYTGLLHSIFGMTPTTS